MNVFEQNLPYVEEKVGRFGIGLWFVDWLASIRSW